MSANIKFVIGICSAFVIPTITYAYMQGQASNELVVVVKKLSSVESELKEINSTIYGFNGMILVNDADLKRLSDKVDVIEMEVNDNTKKIFAIQHGGKI